MEINKNMLKDEIIKHIKTEYKDLPSFEINTQITCSNMDFSEIDVKAKEFGVCNKYIVAYYDNTLYVYDRNKLKLDRKIVESIILFKRKDLNKNVRIFFYRILGILLENNLSKMYLEGIFKYFDAEEIRSIEYYKSGFLFKYKCGDILYLDHYLNVTQPYNLEKISSSVNIQINKDYIVFDMKESDFLERRKFKNLKQLEIIDNKIYVLSKKIKIINFY